MAAVGSFSSEHSPHKLLFRQEIADADEEAAFAASLLELYCRILDAAPPESDRDYHIVTIQNQNIHVSPLGDPAP